MKSFHIQIHIPCREADLVFMTYMREMKNREKGTEEPTRRCSMQERDEKAHKQTLTLADKQTKANKEKKNACHQTRLFWNMMQLAEWRYHECTQSRRRTPSRMPIIRGSDRIPFQLDRYQNLLSRLTGSLEEGGRGRGGGGGCGGGGGGIDCCILHDLR
jgi:hypothetical protein